MSGISGLSQGGEAGPSGLIAELRAVANQADHAAQSAAGGDYLSPPTQRELTAAFERAGTAADALEELGPHIAQLDGGEDGLRLAADALRHLRDGRAALQEGMPTEDEVVRSGAIVADAVSTGSAEVLFHQAAANVRGVADIAAIEAISGDDLLRALTAR